VKFYTNNLYDINFQFNGEFYKIYMIKMLLRGATFDVKLIGVKTIDVKYTRGLLSCLFVIF
jgi:hypothetical protein